MNFIKKISFALVTVAFMAAASPVVASADDRAPYGHTEAADELGSHAPEVKVSGNRVEINVDADNAPCKVEIYALTGQLVKSLPCVSGGQLTVELSAGYYIVKVDRFARRIIVR